MAHRNARMQKFTDNILRNGNGGEDKKTSQEHILPEIEISTKVEEQSDGKGGSEFSFSKAKSSFAPNPKAKKVTPKQLKKIISNEPSSREMEVEREESDWLNSQSDPTPDKDYRNFMKSTGRFPKIYK